MQCNGGYSDLIVSLESFALQIFLKRLKSMPFREEGHWSMNEGGMDQTCSGLVNKAKLCCPSNVWQGWASNTRVQGCLWISLNCLCAPLSVAESPERLRLSTLLSNTYQVLTPWQLLLGRLRLWQQVTNQHSQRNGVSTQAYVGPNIEMETRDVLRGGSGHAWR